MPADWTMAAIVGAAGLRPTLAALRQGQALAFANKECLVCAGSLFMGEAERCGATLLPVDSEHNAVFQVFDGAHRSAIRSITLTASGGPFRTWTREKMMQASRADALAHPTWEMGAKITIDSASMMNKGLEIIEACWLFDLPPEQVDVVVHPQSIVHGMVEYADGSLLAQLGSPDMRTPIASALAWPERMAAPVERLRLAEIARLDFEAPDLERFPAIRLAREAIKAGGIAPAVLNAANEIAVESFLEDRIRFLDIAACVEEVLSLSVGDADMPRSLSAFDDVYAIDARGPSAGTRLDSGPHQRPTITDHLLMSPFEIGFLTFFSFVFLISLVVVIHELGHYWAGRMCGVHAEAFSMGFGPTLASWRDKHGTVWRIAALPLGGYVKFLGDAGAASEPDSDKLEEMRRRMGPDADRCYHFKPVWQRAFVTAAGPLANFILAIVIFSGMALVFGGQQTYQPVVGVVQPGSPSDRAGFEVGDRILQINRRPVDSFGDISQALFDRAAIRK